MQFYRLKALSLIVALGALSSSAWATLVTVEPTETHETKTGTVTYYEAAITATGPDTTANADTEIIDNRDGSVTDICLYYRATASTGTNPTAQIKFMGGMRTDRAYPLRTGLRDAGGTWEIIQSVAIAITSFPADDFMCLSQGLNTPSPRLLPKYLKGRITIGGTDTPGWTGVVDMAVYRRK